MIGVICCLLTCCFALKVWVFACGCLITFVLLGVSLFVGRLLMFVVCFCYDCGILIGFGGSLLVDSVVCCLCWVVACGWVLLSLILCWCDVLAVAVVIVLIGLFGLVSC